ncbi:MAG: metallophosphoesterase family protein [Egibacteraceae bacterium]
MRLLHTSDWHLGAKLGRIDRYDDQLVALRALIEHAENRRPDLIVHSGDVFDGSRPPYRAMALAVKALARLSAIAPTVVLAGNHDSVALLGVLHDLAGLAAPRRLWFVTSPDVLTFVIDGQDVALACLPFVHPNAVVDLLAVDPTAWEGTYAAAIDKVNKDLLAKARTRIDPASGLLFYAAHLHVHGAKPGRSERRITVGEDYSTHTTGLERVVYAAFGHIHDPQLLPGGAVPGRYAGALVPLDFGESAQTKQAVLVTVDAHDRWIEELPLPPGRPLVLRPGITLDALAAEAGTGALDGVILKAVVVSDDPLPDLADRVAQMAPRAAVFELTNRIRNAPARPIPTEDASGGEPALESMFREWQATTTARRGDPARVAELFDRLMGTIGTDAAPDMGVTDLVAAVDDAAAVGGQR